MTGGFITAALLRETLFVGGDASKSGGGVLRTSLLLLLRTSV